MTFKEYIEAIQKTNVISFIKEAVNGNTVCHHTQFGFYSDLTEVSIYINVAGKEVDVVSDYCLNGVEGDEYRSPTYIAVNQTISQLRDTDPTVYVTDRDGVHLQLTFYTASIIPHPAI